MLKDWEGSIISFSLRGTKAKGKEKNERKLKMFRII